MSTYEHVCGACGRPDTPRVWRSGDDEPGDEVRAVLDSWNDLWHRGNGRWWHGRQALDWVTICDDPIVEVILPEPVLS
jgi:hypothetical protein